MSSWFFRKPTKRNLSEKVAKGRLFGLNKLQNHTNEGKGKEKKKERGEEERKVMVALLGLISSVA